LRVKDSVYLTTLWKLISVDNSFTNIFIPSRKKRVLELSIRTRDLGWMKFGVLNWPRRANVGLHLRIAP
jgi:hypothetical protein